MTISIIAVDGPSGSGKGTIAHWLAQTLGWHLLDSGALYRAVGLLAQKSSVDFADDAALAALARALPIEFKPMDSGEVAVFLDNENVSKEIRNERTAELASHVAAKSAVREALFSRQKNFAQAPGLVADGRDMGTVVFPDAQLKIFLTASAEKRAERRFNQLKNKGFDANLAALRMDITQRDQRDANRKISPLKPAEDAMVVDTSEMAIEAVCQHVYQLVKNTFV